MLYLVTLNPAIDQYIIVDKFEKNITNISLKKEEVFGGKAINVGKIVNEFTNDYEIISTIDKKNEEFIKKNTDKLNIKFFDTDYVRTNIKINDNSEITEINESVTDLEQKTKDQIEDYLLKKVNVDDYVLFAGSVSKKDSSFIKELINKLNTKNIILDVPSFNINDFKDIKVLMIKPNEEEIKKLFNKDITIRDAAYKLNKLGIKEVIISLGKDGSYFKSEREEFKVNPIKGETINTVGAGDSFVGGYLIGKLKGYNIKKVLELANACGAASAFSKEIAKKEDIEYLIKKDS